MAVTLRDLGCRQTTPEGDRHMTDEKSGTRSSVGLLDIASQVPGL